MAIFGRADPSNLRICGYGEKLSAESLSVEQLVNGFLPLIRVIQFKRSAFYFRETDNTLTFYSAVL